MNLEGCTYLTLKRFLPMSTQDHLSEVDRELPNSKYRRAFAVARDAAAKVLRHRFRVLILTRNAYAKLFDQEHALQQISKDLGTLLRLTRAWALRQYQEVPWKTLLFVVGAIIYFLSPVDLIPDMIPGVGFVDDIAVVSAVVHAVQADLEAFRAWEDRQLSEEPPEALP